MSRMTEIFLAMHTGSWAFLVILFLVSFFLYKANKNKAGKIVQMILRLFYLIMLVSGVGVLMGYGYPLIYIIKGILAILTIGFMEMALGKAKRNDKTVVPLTLAVIIVVIVILMGFGVISF